MNQKAAFIVIAFLLSGCATKSLTPEPSEVTMSRETPDSDCEEIGRVTGTTLSVKGKAEEALKDMQDDAAKKGANYVRVEQYSGTATSVTGVAFKCP